MLPVAGRVKRFFSGHGRHTASTPENPARNPRDAPRSSLHDRHREKAAPLDFFRRPAERALVPQLERPDKFPAGRLAGPARDLVQRRASRTRRRSSSGQFPARRGSVVLAAVQMAGRAGIPLARMLVFPRRTFLQNNSPRPLNTKMWTARCRRPAHGRRREARHRPRGPAHPPRRSVRAGRSGPRPVRPGE